VIGYEIKDLLIVDFYIRASKSIFFVCIGVKLLNDILYEAWKDSSAVTVNILLQIVETAHDGVSFACSSLSVGEDTTVIALHNQNVTSKLVDTASLPMVLYISS
jgi:hypothetical protein